MTPKSTDITAAPIQYSPTFWYYANAVCTSLYVIGQPLLSILLYNYYNDWDMYTIFMSIMHWMLSVYSILIFVGSRDFHVILLFLQHYVIGITEAFLA